MAQRTLTKKEMNSLKNYRVQCEVCKGDVEILKGQVDAIGKVRSEECAESVLNSRVVFWTGITSAVIIGFAAGRSR